MQVNSNGMFEFQLKFSHPNNLYPKKSLCDNDLFNGCKISICLLNEQTKNDKIGLSNEKRCDALTTFDYLSQNSLETFQMNFKNLEKVRNFCYYKKNNFEYF